MISASSMIPGKTPHPPPAHGILKNGHPQHHHMAHPHGGGHGVMDSRYLDSQKFLVPSLPMSSVSRHETVGVGQQKQRKERSLLNGNHLQDLRENGRSRYDLIPQSQQQQSPRQSSRESVSPMYNDMIHPLLGHPHQMSTNPVSYPSRSGVPIPSSSPVRATSASPKSISPSSKNATGGRGPAYSPQLPGGHDLSSHLYKHSSSNGYSYLQHPSLGVQNHHAAFFAAAAAGSPYPNLFGSPYVPLSHSAASSYLDSFHSNILAQQQHQQKLGAGGAGGSGAPFHTSTASYLPSHLRVPYHPQTTSTTSLHTKLIESASERYNGHAHHPANPTSRNGDYGTRHCNGLSNGGPLGMGPLDPPATIQSVHSKKVAGTVVGKEGTNHHHSATHISRNQWAERSHLSTSVTANHASFPKTSPRDSPTSYEHIRGELQKQAPHYPATAAHAGLYRQRDSNQKTLEEAQKEAYAAKLTKPKTTSNILTFPAELPLPVTRNGHNHNGMEVRGGKDTAELTVELEMQNKNILGHVLNPFQPPGSPKRRKLAGGSGSVQASWNYAPGATPLSPSHQQQLLQAESAKYLNYKPPKPNSVPSSPSYLKPPQPHLLHPQSPKVPKSPTVTFKVGPKVPPPPSPKKVLQAHNENHLNSRSLLLPPMPIEEMPLLEAFRHGSPIQLASGQVKSVENLCGEDFTHSAATMTDKVTIVNCKVLGVQGMRGTPSPTSRPFCKVTLGMESHKQQVVLDSTLEQPFFVLGRGWSSLSPEMSLKLLQLQCSSLQVGDICMALTRNVAGKPRNHSYHQPSPNSKAIATVRPGIVTTTSNNVGTTKSAGAAAQNETKAPPLVILEDDGNDNNLTTPLRLTVPKVIGVTSVTQDETKSKGNDVTPLATCTSTASPVNLKKRRWSHDEPKDAKERVPSPPKIQTDGAGLSATSPPASTAA